MNPFEDCFSRQALNIKNCTQLSEEQKNNFFDTMAHAANDEIVVRKMAEEYFRDTDPKTKKKRKLCGESIVLTDETCLGRMHKWKAIEDELRECKINGDIVPAEAVLGWKERFFTGNSAIKRNVLEEVLETLQDFNAKSPYIIWAFLYKEIDRPFAKENIEELPCRLGLENIMTNEYLPMELKHDLAVDAKKPTAFDAELDKYWCPGGRTCARNECAGKNGFEEAVMSGLHTGGVNLWHAAKVPTFDLALVKK